MKVAYIEDNEGDAEILRMMVEDIKRADINLCVYSSLDELGKDSYDVIICDLNIPPMRGSEILEKVKSMHSMSNIVAFTSLGGALLHGKAEQELISAGADKVFSKFNTIDLINYLGEQSEKLYY